MHQAGLACALLVGLAAVACGDSSGGDDDDATSGPVPLDRFGSRTAQNFCRTAFQCCTSAERGDGAPATEAECRMLYGQLFERVADDIGESVAKGRARYDAAGYGTCLDQASAAGCAGAEALDACSANVVSPLVDVGAGCQQETECIDSTCVGSNPAANSDGVCAAPLAVGAACESGSECSTDSCPFGTCEPKAPNGTECVYDDECASDFCDGNAFVCATATASVCD
jgi:hypothetical protein